MLWADLVIVGIVGISALISWLRGLIKEVLSLAAWVLAFWVSATFTDTAAELLVDHIDVPSVRLIVAFLLLFILTLLLAGIVNFLIAKLIAKTGLSGTDKALGVLFGIARGLALVLILVILAGLTAMPEQPWWDQSLFLGRLEVAAVWVIGFFPESVAAYFSY